LAQIPAENLPKQFGGKCECEGGCQLSDAGPWWDKEWAKEPKWAKKDDTNAIDNTLLPGPTEGGAGGADQVPVGVEPAGAPAAAPVPQPQV
jgi:hypothetical protein